MTEGISQHFQGEQWWPLLTSLGPVTCYHSIDHNMDVQYQKDLRCKLAEDKSKY